MRDNALEIYGTERLCHVLRALRPTTSPAKLSYPISPHLHAPPQRSRFDDQRTFIPSASLFLPHRLFALRFLLLQRRQVVAEILDALSHRNFVIVVHGAEDRPPYGHV